jgi:hypothetical protein
VTEEKKSPIEQALDLLLYAPLGLAITAREELPKLIERGRQEVTGQVTMARVIGEFAVREGERQGAKLVRDAAERMRPPAPPETPARPAAAPPSAAPAAAAPSPNGARPSGGDLAIPGYDSLSASQVVPRLAGLSREELEAVRAYEASTRGRKTILNRVAQLQADAHS